MIGQTLSHFRITAKLGEGGMGEVFRAEDTRLGREVAIKVLPEEFTRDPERLARFDREAHLLASLNHPHIAAIYGLEKVEERQFLVLELVEGETLQERLAHGALAVDEALETARQVAEGLEAAHEAGVIHRDLKPANVKITPEGQVKVLDFGLAKALEPEPSQPDLTHSPTLTQPMTRTGMILGTAAYMSPEQARGKMANKQADIWALGVVLYEMLTGERTFHGETVTDLLAAILEREPGWEALPPETPALVRSLLRRCLQKDQAKRVHDIADARIEIEEALAEPSLAATSSVPAGTPTLAETGWQGGLMLLAGAVVVATVAGLVVWGLIRPDPPPIHVPTRLGFSTPESVSLFSDHANWPPMLALSPDGTQIVYVGEVEGRSQLYLRPLGRLEATPIPSTEGAQHPFFSSDGHWLGFSQEGQLKKVFLDGGMPKTLCDAPALRGASWVGDTILFAPDSDTGLWQVPGEGGTPREVTTPDRDAGETSHRWPQMLPGGQAALFTIGVPSGRQDEARIAVLSLETGQWKVLLEGGSVARYTTTGHIVYASRGSLLAGPFDVGRLEVTGPALPVLADLRMPVIGLASAHFDVSSTGTLAYIPGYPRPSERSLLWVDRQGKTEPVTEERRAYGQPRLSPDGTRLAVAIEGPGTTDVWSLELRHETWTRLTFDMDNINPRWEPDGHRLVFASNREGANNLFQVQADGSAPPERLTTSPDWHFPDSWSPDGRHLAINRVGVGSRGGTDLWVLQLDGDHAPSPYLATVFSERNAAFSPNGRWLAYGSDESGRTEVYVRPFPGPGQKWSISQGGGQEPAWSRDGRELFYRSGDRMMVVAIETEPTFRTEPPQMLFEGRFFREGFRGYDLSLDGQRFLMIQEAEEQPERLQIVVIPSWFEELEQLVSTGKL